MLSSLSLRRKCLAVLRIRCWSQMSDQCILPFDIKETCTFSYNEPFSGTCNFSTQKVAEFVEGIQSPSSFPHVAVYYPSHASFHLYDVLVAHYDDGHVRKLYGYQLKSTCTLCFGAASLWNLMQRQVVSNPTSVDLFASDCLAAAMEAHISSRDR